MSSAGSAEAARRRIGEHWEAEWELARAIADSRPARVLVVSDLHLSAGRDPSTGGWDDLENFMADDAFGRWLEHEHTELAGDRGLLVLNGDVFDFVRVMHVPQDDDDLEAWRARLDKLGLEPPAQLDPTAGERRHGLGTHEHQIVYKLDILTRGHEPFVDALARWLRRGHAMLIGVGNHDVELAWPGVRKALRSTLIRQGAPLAAVRGALAFVDGPIPIENLHVEHGHEHERMTKVDGDLVHTDGQIRLPFGSLANRYLINHLERMNPFLDNIKPSTSAIASLLRRHPLAVFEVWLRSFAIVTDAWRTAGKGTRLYALLVTLGLLAPIVLAGALIAMAIAGTISVWVALVGSVASPLVTTIAPYGLAVAREIVASLRLAQLAHWIRGKLGGSDGGERADGSGSGDRYLPELEGSVRDKLRSGLNGSYDLAYAVIGHTHEQGVTVLADPDNGDSGPRRELLVNTGTWIALWPLDRPDLMGRVHHTLGRFSWSAARNLYVHELLEWDDQAGRTCATSFYTTPDDVPQPIVPLEGLEMAEEPDFDELDDMTDLSPRLPEENEPSP